jgi:hypothetical protein
MEVNLSLWKNWCQVQSFIRIIDERYGTCNMLDNEIVSQSRKRYVLKFDRRTRS